MRCRPAVCEEEARTDDPVDLALKANWQPRINTHTQFRVYRFSQAKVFRIKTHSHHFFFNHSDMTVTAPAGVSFFVGVSQL